MYKLYARVLWNKQTANGERNRVPLFETLNQIKGYLRDNIDLRNKTKKKRLPFNLVVIGRIFAWPFFASNLLLAFDIE